MPTANSSFTTAHNSECMLALPKNCTFFKFMLIEELLLLDDFRTLHCGFCKVIGTIVAESDGKVYLQNLRINSLPSKCSLTEGTLKLRLLQLNEPYWNNSALEVCGELVLQQENEKYPRQLTSRAYCELLDAVQNSTKSSSLENEFKNCYIPALNVYFVNAVDNASALLSLNLEFRSLQMNLNELKRKASK